MLNLSGMIKRVGITAVIFINAMAISGQRITALSPQQIYEKSKGSVVTIYTFDENKAPLLQGSGFVIAKNRIITNYHVLSGSSSGSIIFDDGTVAPIQSVIAGSGPNDLAIVGASTGDRRPLVLADESGIRVGQAVYAIGAPSGLPASFSSGLVSGFREEEGQFRIQITAQIAPGSSGGPVFNDQGLVIGITTSKLVDAGFGFAVGVSDIQHLIQVPLPVPIQLADLSSDNPPPQENQLSSATDLFKQKKYPGALAAFQAVPESARKTFDGQILLCQIEEQLKDYPSATQACDIAAALRPDDAQSYGYKAFAEFASGEDSQAELSAAKATQLQGGDQFKPLLATIFYSEGKYSLVVGQIQATSNDTFALTLLAGAELRSGDFNRFTSLNARISTLKGAPGGWALYQEGIAAEKDLDFDTAAEKFRACDADEDFIDPACIVAMASVEARQGQYESAQKDISTAVTRYPTDHSALSEAMFIDLLVGDTEHASQMHSRLKGLPNKTQDDFSDCLYYYGVNQPMMAEPHCSDAVKESPDSSVAWSNAGYVAIDEGNFPSAAADFKKAKDLYDTSKDKHTVTEQLDLSWGIAMTLYGSGDRKNAKSIYRAIKKDYPEFATLSGLKQLPLLWSQSTQAVIARMISDFK